jgi:hypothetical protein
MKMGRVVNVVLAVVVAGCSSKVDLGDAKKGANAGSGGTPSSASDDAGGGSRSGAAGARAAGGDNPGGQAGASSGGRASASNEGQPGASSGGRGNIEMPPPSGSGGAPAASHDAGTPTFTCDMFPPDPAPVRLVGSAEDNCAQAETATDWGLPLIEGNSGDPTDRRGSIVGRWVPCGSERIAQIDDGLEFGGNGRFRMLKDADGGLVERNETGYYYLFTFQMGPSVPPGAQLNLDSPDGAGLFSFQMRPNAMALKANGIIYARTQPSPENGRDNPVPVRASRCSLAGTWDTTMLDPSALSAKPVALWFDDQGHFLAGAAHADVCAMSIFHGTYELTSDDRFAITTSVGAGLCQWWFDTGFTAAFSPDCNTVTLSLVYDNCTGARGYLTGGMTTLARRAGN